ncbi:sarcosine oxidase subunit gamma [Rhizobium binxianense]
MAETATMDRIEIIRFACTLVQWDAWGGSTAAFEAFATRELGSPLPAAVGGIAAIGAVSAVRVAPRRFWLFAAERDALPRGVPTELGCELDLGEGRERIALRTPRLRDVLARCLAVDWDETLGVATFASLHRIPVMFTRSSAEEGQFVVPRTFARSIASWLEDC